MQISWFWAQLFVYLFLFFIGAIMEYFYLNYSKKLLRHRFVLLFLVWIVLIAYIKGFIQDPSSFANLAFTSLLVFVTWYYTNITRDILEDGKKSREISFMQKQLEEFYYPWLNTMEEVDRVSFEAQLDFPDPDNYCLYCLGEVFPIITKGCHERHKYLYLSNDDIRQKIEEIEKYMKLKPVEYTYSDTLQEQPQTYQTLISEEYLSHYQEEIFDYVMSFKNDLKSQIEEINNNLINLTKIS